MDLIVDGLLRSKWLVGQELHSQLTEPERAVFSSVTRISEKLSELRSKGIRFVNDLRRARLKINVVFGVVDPSTLNLREDCQFILDNSDVIDSVIAPETLSDPLSTWRNFLEIRQRGVGGVVPIYRVGDDARWLDWYVDHTERIAVIGCTEANDLAIGALWESVLTDSRGVLKALVHSCDGDLSTLEAYPWSSAHSAEWLRVASSGKIITLPSLRQLQVSEGSSLRHTSGAHIDSLSEIERESILTHASSLGITKADIATRKSSRAVVNLRALQSLTDKRSFPAIVMKKAQTC